MKPGNFPGVRGLRGGGGVYGTAGLTSFVTFCLFLLNSFFFNYDSCKLFMKVTQN